jgi:hypothetical protein
VTLSLAATGGSGALEYQFWLYRMATQTWTVLQPYSTLNQVVWTPAVQGDYVVQAWVRSQGSPAAYEAWQSSSVLRVSSGTVAVTSLVANQALPAAAGTPITWTATATAGGEVEYLFWQYDFTTANWTLLQAYGPSNSVTWTPAAGRYAIQVWVREVGATGPYDAWKTTDALVITPVGVP